MSEESVVRPSGLEAMTVGLQYVGAMPAGEADAAFYGSEFRLYSKNPLERDTWSQLRIVSVKRTDAQDKDVYSVVWSEKITGEMHEDTEVHVFTDPPALPVLEDEDDGGETEPVEETQYAPELVEKVAELKQANDLPHSTEDMLLIYDAMKEGFEQAGISGLKTEPVVEEA